MTLVDLLLTTLKVGALTFGGGYAMIPVLQHEFVDVRGWLTAREFSDGIAVGQITPGPLMIMVAFMGYKVAGIAGAFVATIGLFAPTFFGVIVVARVREQLSKNAWWSGAMKGIGVAVAGLLLAAAVLLAQAALSDLTAWVIAVASFATIVWRKIDAMWVIIAGALIGAIVYH
jgi:chromate transporter